MQHNQPIIIISTFVCALFGIRIGQLFLFLLANIIDPSVAPIVLILSTMLFTGAGFFFFSFFLRGDSQSRSNHASAQFPTRVGAEATARAGTNTRTVEVMSAIVVMLTAIGVFVGIVFPQSMVRPVLALALILWPILYRWHKN